MVDVNYLKKLLEESKSSEFQFLTDEVTVVKLLDTNPLFVKYNQHFINDRASLCRKTLNPDEECLLCKHSSARIVKKLLFYGVHITNEPQLKVFCVPVTVGTAIINLLITDDWKCLVEPESEILIIKKSGQGLKTRYSVTVTKKKYKHNIANVASLNLNDVIKIPTLEEQAELLENDNEIPF